jgi:hypothetical protein
MLRISTIEADHERRLVVEGKLIAPWTNELSSECEKAKQNLKGRVLIVELKNISVISPDGENVLASLVSEKVKLRCCGVYAKQVLRQIDRRIHAQARKPTS